MGAVAASPKSLDAAAVITADTRRVVVKSVVIKTCEADDAHVKETVMHYALTLMVCEAREARLEAVAQAAATGSVAAAAAGHETIYLCAVSAPGGVIARRAMEVFDPATEVEHPCWPESCFTST